MAQSRMHAAAPKRSPRPIVIALVGLALVGMCGGLIFTLNAIYASRQPPPPPIVGRNCGAVTLGGVSGYVSGSPTAEDCLWHAYQPTCTAATLLVTFAGSDAYTDTYLTVQPKHGTCAVTDIAQSHIDGNSNAGSSSTYTCGGLLHQFGGLVAFACGNDDNIVIPYIGAVSSGPGVPTAVAQMNSFAASCGTISLYTAPTLAIAQTNSSDNTTAPTDCFLTYWNECASVSLTLLHYAHQAVVQQTFTITAQTSSMQGPSTHPAQVPCPRVLTVATQSQSLNAPPSDITIVACAGLARSANGLVATGCGVNPPLTIPSAPLVASWRGYPSLDQAGQLCSPQPGSRDYRTCFWQAYQTCQPVTVRYNAPGSLFGVVAYVTAQPQHGHCMLTADLQFVEPYTATILDSPAVTATCASARQQNNEIVVSNCGTFGDIIIA